MNNHITKEQSNTLKIIAIATMVVDHIGAISFPELIGFRIIGRLAFPLFAYQLAVSYEKTSNSKAFASRILMFAAVSQIPYAIALNPYELNILFTFFFALLLIYFVDKKKAFLALLTLTAIIALPLDYGYYGALMPLLFWIFNKSATKTMVASLWTVFQSAVTGSAHQLVAIAGVFLGNYLRVDSKIKLNKWFFYWFYPSHLLALYLVDYLYSLI